MLPVECIIRGYISGSGWESYVSNSSICDIKLPEGLKESQKLPTPLFTPSTKAALGNHDENISFEKTCEILGNELATKLKDAEILKPYVKDTVLFIHKALDEEKMLKELTRGNSSLTLETFKEFINTLEISKEDKESLLALSPENYTGIADKLVDFI